MPHDLKPRVGVSYSWKEEREGQNQKAVGNFCAQLTSFGIEVVRDVDRTKHGDCISSFMQNIGASDSLCVFLSDSYLRSPNCMYELLVAWQRSKDDADEFRKRVKFWVMPGFAGMGGLDRRVPYLEFWQNEEKESAKRIKKHTAKGLSAASQKEHNTIHEISRNVDEILTFVKDTLSPGTSEEFQAWIQSCFPNANANQNDKPVDGSDVYQHIFNEINSILERDAYLPLRDFLQTAAPRLLVSKGSACQLNPAVAARDFDLVPVLHGISERLSNFPAKPELWTALGQICGGLVVLGIDPKWAVTQREVSRSGSVDLAADKECFNVVDGRQVNWLHLVTSALGDGRARLEKVFGKASGR